MSSGDEDRVTTNKRRFPPYRGFSFFPLPLLFFLLYFEFFPIRATGTVFRPPPSLFALPVDPETVSVHFPQNLLQVSEFTPCDRAFLSVRVGVQISNVQEHVYVCALVHVHACMYVCMYVYACVC